MALSSAVAGRVRGPLHENDLGQLLFLKLDELRWGSTLEHTLRRLHPGGVLVDAPLPNAAEKLREFLSKLAGSIPTVPFLALGEEGGLMDPLQAFLPPLPSPRAVAAKGLAAVRRLGELVGSALKLLGFNTDFAPLLDLASPNLIPGRGAPWRAPTETRAFSTNPQQTTEFGGAFLTGLERHELLACGKHFPGYGGARAIERRWPNWFPSPWPSCGASIWSPIGRFCPGFPLIW